MVRSQIDATVHQASDLTDILQEGPKILSTAFKQGQYEQVRNIGGESANDSPFLKIARQSPRVSFSNHCPIEFFKTQLYRRIHFGLDMALQHLGYQPGVRSDCSRVRESASVD